MHILHIPQSDAAVSKSTNLDWVVLGLSCWSVHDTDVAFNGGYLFSIYFVYWLPHMFNTLLVVTCILC